MLLSAVGNLMVKTGHGVDKCSGRSKGGTRDAPPAKSWEMGNPGSATEMSEITDGLRWQKLLINEVISFISGW